MRRAQIELALAWLRRDGFEQRRGVVSVVADLGIGDLPVDFGLR